MGIIAALERFLVDADERGNAFLVNLLEKQHTRLKTLFDRHIVSIAYFLTASSTYPNSGGAERANEAG